MLTTKDIQFLLGLVGQKVVHTPTDDFPFTVTKESPGYSDDPERGKLQAKLSIMLEAAGKLGR